MGVHPPPRAQDANGAQVPDIPPCGRVEVLLQPLSGGPCVRAGTGEASGVVPLERLVRWLRQRTQPLLAEPLALPPGTPSPGPEVSG